MDVIYILSQQGITLFYSPRRKDLVDYALNKGVSEASIIEVPLVPSNKE